MNKFVSALLVSASVLSFSPAFAAPTQLPATVASEVWQSSDSEISLSDWFLNQVVQREQSSGLTLRVVATTSGDDLSGDRRGFSVTILRSALGESWMRSTSDPARTVVVIYTAERGTGHGSTGVRVGRTLNNIGILPPHLSADDGPILPVVRAYMPAQAERALLQVIDNIITEYQAGRTLQFGKDGVLAAAAAEPSVAPSTIAASDPAPATSSDDDSGWGWWPWILGGGLVVVLLVRSLGSRGRAMRQQGAEAPVSQESGSTAKAELKDPPVVPTRTYTPVHSAAPSPRPSTPVRSAPRPSSRVSTPSRRTSSGYRDTSSTSVVSCTAVTTSSPAASCSKCGSSSCSGGSGSSCGGGGGCSSS